MCQSDRRWFDIRADIIWKRFDEENNLKMFRASPNRWMFPNSQKTRCTWASESNSTMHIILWYRDYLLDLHDHMFLSRLLDSKRFGCSFCRSLIKKTERKTLSPYACTTVRLYDLTTVRLYDCINGSPISSCATRSTASCNHSKMQLEFGTHKFSRFQNLR